MIIFLSGKISGDPDYKAKFQAAEDELTAQGHTVLNPTTLPATLHYEKLMQLCFGMIDAADAVYQLPDWMESVGARREFYYAGAKNIFVGERKDFNGFARQRKKARVFVRRGAGLCGG